MGVDYYTCCLCDTGKTEYEFEMNARCHGCGGHICDECLKERPTGCGEPSCWCFDGSTAFGYACKCLPCDEDDKDEDHCTPPEPHDCWCTIVCEDCESKTNESRKRRRVDAAFDEALRKCGLDPVAIRAEAEVAAASPVPENENEAE